MMRVLDMFSLKGKVSLVTGGERGIGLSIAKAFAQAGSDVVVAGLDENSAPEAEKIITAEGVRFLFVPMDVTAESQIAAMVRKVRQEFGQIDIACNNAGISLRAEAAEMPLAVWQKVLDINLTGYFLVSREVACVMLEQGKGSIVNIASISGLIVNRPLAQCNYNAAKAGVIQLTKSMACEWALRGIRVNAIAPGYIRTPLTERRFLNPDDTAVPIWRDMTPMGREGMPEEVAAAALYFASDASSYTTGSVLTVDGGYTAW